MTDFIVLNNAQANAVRGKTNAYSAIEPIEMEDGRFILPTAVIDDTVHASKRSALQAMPKLDDKDANFPKRKPDVP